MPTYDYRCEANGRTVEVSHGMSEDIRTWGELCRHATTAPGDTPDDTPVTKVVSLGFAHTRGPSGDTGPCGPSCGCHPH